MMKKRNVKYIGSAVAVALLAAGSPVIIHDFIPSTIVQAAIVGDADMTPPVDPYTYFTAFKNQFSDQYISGNGPVIDALDGKKDIVDDYPQFSYFNPDQPTYFKDLQDDTDVQKLMSSLMEYKTENSDNYYYYRDVLVSIGIYDGDGNQVKLNSDADYNDRIAEFKAGKIKYPLTLRVRLTTDDGTYKMHDGNNVNYSPHTLEDPKMLANPSLMDFSVTLNKSEIHVTKDTDTPTIPIGTSMSDTALNGGDNSLSIIDKYTSENSADKTRTPIYGQSLFNSRGDASDYVKSADFSATSTTAGVSGVIDSNKNIVKGGKYYQTITYSLDDANDAALTAMLTGGKDPNTNKNVDKYDTYINDNSSTGDPATLDTDYFFNSSKHTLSIIRPVIVTDTIASKLPTVSVQKGTSKNADVLTDKTGYGLTDDTNNPIATSDIDIDQDDYYTDPSAKTPVTDLIDSDGNFTKTGTFYRKVKFTLSSGDTSNITNNNGAILATGNEITYTQKIVVQNGVTVNIDNQNATIGDSESNTTSDVSKDTLENINGSLIDTTQGNNGIKFGTAYYKDNGDSAYDSQILSDPIKATATDGVVDANGKFAKSGDYLRTITFYLVKGAIDTNSFGADDRAYSLDPNTDNGTVTYIQKVHISPSAAPTAIYKPVTVTAGATSDDPNLTATAGDTLSDPSLLDTTKGLNNSGVEFGTNYYTDNTLATDSKVDNLNTPETYYRTIKFYLNKDVTSFDFTTTGAKVDKADNSISFVQAITVNPVVKTDATVNVEDLNVINRSAEDKTTVTGDTVTFLDDNSVKSIEFGTNYYKVAQDALDGKTASAKTADSSGKYNMIGTYYRTITFNLNGDADNYNFTPLVNGVDYHTDTNSVTYVQKVVVGRKKATLTMSPVNVPLGTSTEDTSVTTVDSDDYTTSLAGTKQTTLGTDYFATIQDALDSTDITKTVSDINSKVIQDGKFVKSGTFYRVVAFKENVILAGANELAGDNIVGDKYSTDIFYYAQPVTVDEAADAKLTVAPEISVQAGKDKTDADFNDASKYTLTDTTGNIPLADSPKLGKTYFGTAEEALNLGSTGVTSLTTPRDYYRTITFTPKDGVKDTYNLAALKGDTVVVGDDGTITVAQLVHVTAMDAASNIVGINTTVGTDIASLVSDHGTADITTTGADGKPISIIDTDKTVYGDQYFFRSGDALGNTNPQTGKFTVGNGKVYYRRVTLTLANGKIADYNLNGTKDIDYKVNGDGTITYAQPITVASATVTAKVADGINVTSGENIADEQGNETNTLSNPTILADTDGVTFGNYYPAYVGANETTLGKILAGRVEPTTDPVNGDVYGQPGTYYREVIFHLKTNALDGNTFGDSVISGQIDEDGTTVTYIQKITIAGQAAKVDMPDSIKVSVGLKGKDDATNLSTSGYKLTSATDETVSLSDTDPTAEPGYYTSLQNAQDIASPEETPTTSRTYFRRVTFTPNDAAKLYDLTALAKDNPNIQINTDGTVTYIQTVNVSGAEVNLPKVSDVTVSAGLTGTDDATKLANNDYQLTDANDSTKTLSDKPKLDDVYYTDPTEAYKGSGTTVDNLNKADTYYRRVTFTLNPDDASSYDLKSLDNKSTISVAADGSTVTVIQTITVDGNKAQINGVKTLQVTGSADTKLTNSDGYTLTADDGKTSLASDDGPSLGTKYYATADEALNPESSTPVSNINNAGGKYFRRVTFVPNAEMADKYDLKGLNSDTVKYNDNGTVTVAQEIDVQGSEAAIAITDPINVSAGLVGTDDEANLSTSDGYKITSEDGKVVLSEEKPNLGTTYYTSASDALGQTGTTTDNLDEASDTPYYRLVTFKLNSNASAYDLSKLDADNVKYDADAGTVTYAQAIKVGANKAIATTATLKNTTATVKADGTNDSKLADTSAENYDITSDTTPAVSLVDKSKGVTYGPLSADDANPDGLKNGIITAPGKYYRTVTLNLLPDAKLYDLTNLGGKLSDDGTQITFTQTIQADANAVTGGVNGTTVDNGTPISKINDPSDVTLDVPNDGIEFGGLYTDPDATTPYTGQTATTAGDYFQPVTITVSGDIGAYTFPANATKVGNKVTFIRTVTVKAATHTGGGSTTGGNTGNNTGNNTGTDNNNGNGTGDEDDWTYYQNPGIVTTKTDHSIYTLNNHANQTISNRGLSADTAWKTDQYRTNRAGVKQYRVATGEWVDSHDVIFTDLNDNTNTNDDWTYYKDPGVVLTKVDQTYYTLNNWSNDKVLNRALDEQTYWLTDQYRTNRSGVKQYRVATNEWIDSHDVIYIKDIKDIVNVDETQTFYTLYTDELTPVQNRALEAKSSWRTDKEAIDSDGTVYYRVATNEWVKQVNGVHLDTSIWYKG